MLLRLISIVFLSLGFVSVANADIQDRINACEAKGGGSCVYALLRELAKTNGTETPVSKCECSTYEWSPGSACSIGQFQFRLSRDSRSVGKSACYGSADAAYVECIKASNKDLACR